MKTLKTKKIFLIAVLFSVGLFAGCTTDPADLNGKLVKDVDGNVYEVENHMAGVYKIRTVSPEDIENYVKMKSK